VFKRSAKTEESAASVIPDAQRIVVDESPKLFVRKSKKDRLTKEGEPAREVDSSVNAHKVHFDGSQPWTANLIEVDNSARFEPIEGFSPEEKLSILRPIFWTRQTILFLAAGLSLVLSAGATERLGVGLLFVLLSVPASLATHLTVRKRVEFPLWLPVADAIVAALLVAVSPNMFEVAVVLLSIQFIAVRPAFHLPIIGAAMVIGFGAIGGVAIFQHPINRSGFGLLSMAALFIPIVCKLAYYLQEKETATHRKYLDLLGGLDAVAWEADPTSLELISVSPQVRSMFGFERAMFVRNWKEYVHPDDQEIEEAARRGVVQSGHKTMAIDFRMINSRGETVFVRNVIAVERDLSGKVVRVRGVLSDVSSQHEAENTIRKQAQYDTLTGLPNRSLFNEQLRRRLDDARLTSETLSVHLLDLNGFKEVNDTLGHAVGDQLLQAIAGRLAAYLPDRSLVARLGGDEFAVVTFPANTSTAQNVAEAIAAALQPPITVDDMTIQAGASTGIAMFPADGDSAQSLMRRADAAMYEAKQNGQTYIFSAPDDDEGNMRRLQLLGELRASIAGGDFRLYHQPKIDAYTGQVVGTEGLIRWHHKQFGLLSPGAFVELSELSGLIQPLTRWVIEQGIRDLAEWRKAGFAITVALNLSVRNFFDQGLPVFIAELLREFKVPGSQLVLEITESEVMADRNLARTALAAFRDLGVKISIDDFGTGFSSLSQLQLLPIDEIKVDQSFVAGMLENEQDHVIVRSIIDLAHNLSLQVVAEGAETPEQLQALRELHADRIQGYVISKPLPREECRRKTFPPNREKFRRQRYRRR
jgi:diguanylate cyclase (GGDEF)-like protein/PAS domain S-box-containing protein